MTIEINEKFASVRAGESFIESAYLIYGTMNEVAARQAFIDALAGTRGNMSLVEEEIEVEEVADNRWEGVARWKSSQSEWGAFGGNIGDVEIEGDTGGGTQHVSHSKATVAKYPAGAPDNHQAINVGADLSVAGVDIGVRQFNFQVRKIIDVNDFNTDYITTLYNLTYTVNSAPITITDRNNVSLAFAAGELLFLGASWSPPSSGRRQVLYRFSAAKNATNLDIDGITVSAKLGWDYLHVRYAGTMESNRLAPAVVGVYVDRLYDPADHNDLDI